MKYYTLKRKIPDKNATLLSITNNQWVALGQGEPLPNNLEEPIECALDPEHNMGKMASFYQARGLICTQAFVDVLLSICADNIETKNVVIHTHRQGLSSENYVLLNIVGCVSGANLQASDTQHLGDGMFIIDALALSKEAVIDKKIFLIQEDTSCVVVNEEVFLALGKQFNDLYFEEVQLIY